MPKLTSKITVKLEPGLLDKLQDLADSEGLPVSSYIRKAMIEHVGTRQEDESSQYMRIQPTNMEFRVINKLMGLGYLMEPEDLYHKAFDLYLKEEYETIRKISEKEFLDVHIIGSGNHLRKQKKNSRSFRDEGKYVLEDDEP